MVHKRNQSATNLSSNLSIPVRITERMNLYRQLNVSRSPNNCISVDINNSLLSSNNFKSLNFCLINTRSLNNKSAEFIDFICDRQPDIVALTETWFHEHETAARSLCTPTGYNLFDHPRLGRHGGGTGVLFRNNLTVNRVSAAERRSFEYSEWHIKAGTRRIRLIVVYRIPYSDIHPISTTTFFDEFSKFLESVVLCTDLLLITGDFNIHVDVTDDADAVKLQELLESTGLQQHVNVPTHIHGHTLDLIITRLSENIIASPPRNDHLFSDHMPVHCNLLVNKPDLKRINISYRKIKSINVDAFRNDLSNSDLCKNMLSMELNDLVDSYNDTLSSTLDRHAPVKCKTVIKRPTVPWFTEEVKLAKRARRIQ
ncbi:uncharacterized protein LOC114522790 [Dendronephthya gigantea]|uniref:uncharacterized protein LOC114522790 n=1 Tax=Dendronephthya gigantea TaxID=151771 RepID=UPI00106BDC9E|nr:uncharacterized protein LOC114522790 [Dendronephthya gigantea]